MKQESQEDDDLFTSAAMSGKDDALTLDFTAGNMACSKPTLSLTVASCVDEAANARKTRNGSNTLLLVRSQLRNSRMGSISGFAFEACFA